MMILSCVKSQITDTIQNKLYHRRQRIIYDCDEDKMRISMIINEIS